MGVRATLLLGFFVSACGHATLPPNAPAQERLPTPAGTPTWEAAVRRALMRHDADRSGDLDAAELERVGCELWRELDQGTRDASGTGLIALYGLSPGYLFRAEPLGLSAATRGDALRTIERCVEGAADTLSDLDKVLNALSEISAAATTNEWDDEVALVLLMNYDHNHNGSLDSAPEFGRIPCEVWIALDRAVRRERTTSLLALYGFAPGYIWIGQQLGVAEAVRDYGADRLLDCGIDE